MPEKHGCQIGLNGHGVTVNTNIYPVIKRMLDLIFALLGVILLSPLLILIALAIMLDSQGPVIFKQDRLGLNGRVFRIYKFRSMCMNAEKSGVYEKKDDPRVTRVGRVIRRTSIDELPQFINIIKGDMSFIGPRPVLTYHPWPLTQYSIEQLKRFSVRPGVTGWAQIKGRKDVPWDQRIRYDIQYVDHCSFTLDAKILFRTIGKVITMQDNVNVQETVAKPSPSE